MKGNVVDIKFELIRNQEALKNRKISMLSNSIHFLLDCVFIIANRANYQLFVSHRGEILKNKRYLSLEDAKSDFEKLYMKNGFEGVIFKPEWSYFYKPESTWLESRLNGVPFHKF
jgi:hypothetical protein